MKVFYRSFVFLLLLCSFSYPADAFMRRGGSGTASNWNGGLVQTTLDAAFDTSGEFLPLNRMQDAADWTTVSGNLPVNVTEENANGFPSNNTNLVAVGGWRTTFTIPSSTERPGNWNFSWTAPGATTWAPGGTVVSINGAGCTNTSTTVTGTNCTAVVTYSTIQPQVNITSVASGGPTSLQVYHTGDAAAIASGYVCKTSKYAQVMGSVFGVIRDLNRGFLNYSNVALWNERTPSSWFTWGANGSYFPQSLVTSNAFVNTSGSQYTLAFTGFTLADKAHVIAKPGAITAMSKTSTQTVSSGVTLTLNNVTNIVVGMSVGNANNQNSLQQTTRVTNVNGGTNTITLGGINPFQGTVTTGDTIYFSSMLNVNSTGSFPIQTASGATPGLQNTDSQIYNNWTTFTFDNDLQAWLQNNSSNGNMGLSGGWPPEKFTQCANELGVHPWYVQPPYSVDPPTDYVHNLDLMLQSNLLPGLIPRIEPPNETWNNAFFVTPYADNKEYLRTSANFDRANWYGRAASRIGQIVSADYSNNRTLYKMMVCTSESPAAASPVTNATYNSGSGLVTVTTFTPIQFLQAGQLIVVRGLTGTGSFSSAIGAFTTISGTGSNTIKYTIATGLTMTLTTGSTSYAEPGSGAEQVKLTSPEYVSNGGSPAYLWATDYCPTAYWSSGYSYGSPTQFGFAYWYANGASSGQQDTLIGNYLAASSLTNFVGDLWWFQNVLWPSVTSYLATYAGTATIGFSMYEGGYASNQGCGFTYACAQYPYLSSGVPVQSVTLGTTTTLNMGATATSVTSVPINGSSSTMTVGGSIVGTFAVGQYIFSPSFNAFTQITGLGTGTGGAGTYIIFGSQTVSSGVAVTANQNAWDYICNTASICTGGNPKTTLTFGGGCGLNGLDPAVLSATPTTIVVNVNSTGFTGCTTGSAAYDGAGNGPFPGPAGYLFTFDQAVKQNTNPANLQAYELTFLQSFYSAGGRFPAEYDTSNLTDWAKVYPDVYGIGTPVLTSVQQFNVAP